MGSIRVSKILGKKGSEDFLKNLLPKCVKEGIREEKTMAAERKDTEFNRYWLTAFQLLLDDRRHLTLTEIAESLKVSIKHFGLVKNGQAFASEFLKEKIAEFFNLQLDEMAFAGRRYEESGEWFPYILQILQLNDRNERAKAIYDRVVEEKGLKGLSFFEEPSSLGRAPGVNAYVKGEVSEGELYSLVKGEINRVLQAALQQSERSTKQGRRRSTKARDNSDPM